MKEDILEAVTTRLDAVAEKLGVATEHFYPVFVKQQVLTGAMLSAAGATILVICTALLYIGYKGIKDNEEWGRWFMFFSCLFGLAGLGFLIPGLARVLNPEYMALMSIMEMVK